MSARVLVVDDLLPNVKLLEIKLSLEYFDVLTAMSGPDALSLCAQGLCDIVLLDVMMPGMDGFEVCRRLKNDPATAHLPVVMVSALDQPADRLRGLEAGADDFLTKPIDHTALLTRVRSLLRLKAVTDELRSRALATRALGMGDPLALAVAEQGLDANILLIEDRPSAAERISSALLRQHRVTVETDPHQALLAATDTNIDVALVSLDLQGFDGLRLCSQLRSLERTRNISVVMIAEADAQGRITRGLDFGVHDFLTRPVDQNELLARVRTQVRRRRFSDILREALQASVELSITDDLTGLHNRRYFDRRMGPLFSQAATGGADLACLLLDIDRFKSINDTYGHAAGDDVLRAFANRVRLHSRNIDIVSRYGGEEVAIILPGATLDDASKIAERIRERVEQTPFMIANGTQAIPVTVSIGVAMRQEADVSAADMLKRADDALYRAKAAGRNRVEAAAA